MKNIYTCLLDIAWVVGRNVATKRRPKNTKNNANPKRMLEPKWSQRNKIVQSRSKTLSKTQSQYVGLDLEPEIEPMKRPEYNLGDQKRPKWGALIPNGYDQKEAALDQTCRPKPNKLQGFLTIQEPRRKRQWKKKP